MVRGGPRCLFETKARRIAIAALLLSVVPGTILVRGHEKGSQFLGFILAGQEFRAKATPELLAQGVPAKSRFGYDGQFYAQIALDPTLRNPDVVGALDNAPLRTRRIGLPALAYLLGLGRPGAILHIYSVLNFGFWALLLSGCLYFVGMNQPRDFLLAASLLWTTGVVVSMERALTDLPALTLGIFAVWLRARDLLPASLLGLSALVRDVSLIQTLALGWPRRWGGRWIGPLTCWALVLLPMLAWWLYQMWVLPEGANFQHRDFTPFLSGVSAKIGSSSRALAEGFRIDRLFEIVAVLSMVVQAGYLLHRPRFRSPSWRLGIGFTLLLAMTGGDIFTEQYGYTRIFLPLTASFNLLLHEHESGWRYRLWFTLGNFGMTWMLFRGATF